MRKSEMLREKIEKVEALEKVLDEIRAQMKWSTLMLLDEGDVLHDDELTYYDADEEKTYKVIAWHEKDFRAYEKVIEAVEKMIDKM